MCWPAAGSSARAGPSWRWSSSAKAMERWRRERTSSPDRIRTVAGHRARSDGMVPSVGEGCARLPSARKPGAGATFRRCRRWPRRCRRGACRTLCRGSTATRAAAAVRRRRARRRRSSRPIGRRWRSRPSHPLGRLAGKTGWSLRLGRDHAPAGLVQIVHVSTGAADHLAARDRRSTTDAQASIVETFIGDGWTNRLTDIALGKGARLMLSRRVIGR